MRRQSFFRALFELFSSMRFAISLLTIIAVASIVGTVLKQNEPYPSYVIEFGQFWFGIFEWLGLFDVYHSGWFLLILLFLVVSTALCIYRNTPGMLREIRSYREHASEASLQAFSHRTNYPVQTDEATAERLAQWLAAKKYAFKQVRRDDGSTLFAGKTGSMQKLGYFFAHGAIVLICIGGLLDGNIILKLQQLSGEKRSETRDLPQSQVPAASRLGAGNLSYRGNVTVPTGSAVDMVFLNSGDGYMVQELPFELRLDRFHVEHYATGQPKLFASDVTVTSKASGKSTKATIKVNHPLVIDGVSIYQASFGDGGSKLELAQWPTLGTQTTSTKLPAKSQQNFAYQVAGKRYTLEMGDFRLFNIEAIDSAASKTGSRMDDAVAVTAPKNTQNIGPSIQFKLRDSQGQAREFQNYMQPVVIDNHAYFLFGVRSTPGEPFTFLRIPADENGEIISYMRLRALLLDRAQAAGLADAATGGAIKDNAGAEYRAQFRQSVEWALDRFAAGGFPEIERFLQAKVPADKREIVARTYVRLMQGIAVEAYQRSREQAGLQRAEVTPERFRFIVDSLVAISTSFDYGAPVLLQLTGFDEVKASGFQITRSPGKNLVYLGSLMLVLGVFAMFYIKEKRVWLLVKPQSVLLAMSANRKGSDFDAEFQQSSEQLEQLLKG